MVETQTTDTLEIVSVSVTNLNYNIMKESTFKRITKLHIELWFYTFAFFGLSVILSLLTN